MNSPGCFGAASVFRRDSGICRACRSFDPCAAESLKRLKAISHLVNVEDLLKEHDAAKIELAIRMKARLSSHEPQAAPPVILIDNNLTSYDEELSPTRDKLTEAPATLLSDDADDAPSAVAIADSERLVEAEDPLITTLKVNDNPVPPRFRNVTESLPFQINSADYSPAETHALRRRQMDDLVYLSKQSRSYSVHPKYEGIFTPGGGLNRPLAVTFVEDKAWNTEGKATELLKLSPFEQLQCCTLASKKINDKWRNSIKHADAVEKKLNALVDQDQQFGQHVPEFTKLAQAIYLCEGWDSKWLPLILGWLTGKRPISRQAIQAKMKRLKHRLA
jgi:hypothetical protein